MKLFEKLDPNKKNYNTLRASLLWTKFQAGDETGIIGEIKSNGTARVTFENQKGEVRFEFLPWSEIAKYERITTNAPFEMIVAMGKNREIGKDNKLLWDLPEDMEHFKRFTIGKTVVMGSKTFESIGKPLPMRKNVILTSNPDKFKDLDVRTVSSIDEVIDLSKKEEVIIIGGSSVYESFIKHIDILHVTEVEKEYEADSFFPSLKENGLELLMSVEGKMSGEKFEDGSKNPKYFFNSYEKEEK